MDQMDLDNGNYWTSTGTKKNYRCLDVHEDDVLLMAFLCCDVLMLTE